MTKSTATLALVLIAAIAAVFTPTLSAQSKDERAALKKLSAAIRAASPRPATW